MISIYVNYFTPSKILATEAIKPIQVGAANSKHDLGVLRDDSGENISARNSAYCEMTGVYWAWKNDRESDVLGFFHYRRYLDFRPERSRTLNAHGMIEHPRLGEKLISEYGLSLEVIENVMADVDMIIPEAFDVRAAGPKTVRQQYDAAPHHHLKDLELAGRIIADLSPQYSQYFDMMMEGSILYPNNMFLFRRPVFERFCEWIFPILQRLDTEIDTSSYSQQEARAVGYIAERLFTVFVLSQKEGGETLSIRELRRVFVQSTAPDPVEPPLPVTDLPVVTLVASCDADYVPHLAALIHSTFQSTSTDVFIDFLILDGGISAGQKRLLENLSKFREHASLSYIDMRFEHLDIPVHGYFSRATFFRLSLPTILRKRDRIIFLDTDMVVVDDLSALSSIELNGALIAAVPDLIIRAFAEMQVRSIDTTGSLPTAEYVADYLGLTAGGAPAVESYFQAGTLVMDLNGLRESDLMEKAIEDLAQNVYWFLDQDILNKYLNGRVKFLDNRWNALWMDDAHASSLKEEDLIMYESSLQDPAIVHYAGTGKPWMDARNPLSHYYWEFLRGTPWYETMLFSFLDRRYANQVSGSKRPQVSLTRRSLRRVGSFVWRRLPYRVKGAIWPIADRINRSIG